MATNKGATKVQSKIPPEALSQMHPTTRKIIKQINTSRAKRVTLRLKDAREAKNRQEALRRANKRGYVKYKEAHYKGRVLSVGLR